MKPARVRPLACALLPAALALAYAACSTDNAALPTTDLTYLYIDPVYFRGDVPCGNLQGAMQSYVVTLTDVSVVPPVTLPSSPPTPCSQLVGFNDKLIVADHQYAATIDAYGEPPCDVLATNAPCLVSFGGLYNSGARAMAEVLKEDVVLPNNPAWRPLRQAESKWKVVRCEAETALLLAGRRFTSCSPNLELLEGQSGIAISIDQIRGGLPCAPAKTTSVSRIKVEVVSVVGGSPSGPTNGAAGSSSGASGAGGNGLRVSVLAGASGDAGASGEGGAGGDAGASGGAGFGGDAGTGGAGGEAGGSAGAGGDAGAGGSSGDAGAGGSSGDAGAGGDGGDGGSAGGSASGCDGTSNPVAGQICDLLCEPGAKLVYLTNNNVSATYSFRVTVFDGNGVLRWVTSCSGEPVKGIGDLPIACDPLSSSLSLRVPFAVLTEAYTKRFQAAPPACAASAGAPGLVDVSADRGQGLTQTFSCGSALSFEALPAGAYSVRGTFNVRVAPEGPVEARPFFCEGYALPDEAGGSGDATPLPLRCQFL